jgi:glycosyltransferase involved in cell wall biosynthesis
MPRVSVIIPAYNGGAFLDRGLATVVSQTYGDFEVIVADDGSTDDTAEVVAKYAPKVRYLYQPNRGVSAARNLALSAASGEFLAHMDADDMWRPDKLARQIAFFAEHQDCGVVHSDVTIIDEDDRVVHERFNRETKRFPPEGRCLADLLRRCHIQVSSAMERREATEKMGAFDLRLRAAEDYYRWIVAAMEGVAFGYIDEPLAMYRWRTGSLFQSRSMTEGYVALFRFVLQERKLAERYGEDVARAARARLWDLRWNLAYREYSDGKHRDARKLLRRLLIERPRVASLYLDYAKACLPPSWAQWLRRRLASTAGEEGPGTPVR